MPDNRITILGPQRTAVATAQVKCQGNQCSGSVKMETMPPELRALFEKYEELVNGQVFSLLDEVEEQISATTFTAVFENGKEAAITDLQLYPRSGSITFKTMPTVMPALHH